MDEKDRILESQAPVLIGPERYDREMLESLIWEKQLNPSEIVALYNGKFDVTLEMVLTDIIRWRITPRFIEGYDVVDDVKRSIREFDDTIASYTDGKRASYRKLDAIQSILRDIKGSLLGLLSEEFKDNKKLSEELKGIKELLVDVSSSLSIKDLIKIQQDDEAIRINYFKLRQEERKVLMKVVDTQQKALESESYLVATYEELSIIDRKNGTNYAPSFLANVRGRVMKRLSSERVLVPHNHLKIDTMKESPAHKAAVRQKTSDAMKEGLEIFKKKCHTLKESFNINYNVAQNALGIHRRAKDANDNETLTIEQCIKLAQEKEDARIKKLKLYKKGT